MKLAPFSSDRADSAEKSIRRHLRLWIRGRVWIPWRERERPRVPPSNYFAANVVEDRSKFGAGNDDVNF